MSRYILQFKTFAIFLAGDLLGTLGIRFIAGQSQWAVLETVFGGLLWVYGVKLANQTGTTMAAIIGMALGVEIGILIPL